MSNFVLFGAALFVLIAAVGVCFYAVFEMAARTSDGDDYDEHGRRAGPDPRVRELQRQEALERIAARAARKGY